MTFLVSVCPWKTSSGVCLERAVTYINSLCCQIKVTSNLHSRNHHLSSEIGLKFKKKCATKFTDTTWLSVEMNPCSQGFCWVFHMKKFCMRLSHFETAGKDSSHQRPWTGQVLSNEWMIEWLKLKGHCGFCVSESFISSRLLTFYRFVFVLSSLLENKPQLKGYFDKV